MTTTGRRIKGILFDLGDTLLDFGQVDIPSLFEAGAKLAYEYLEGLGYPLPSFSKYHRTQLWAIRWNFFKSRFTRREFNVLDVLGCLSARMGHNLTAEQIVELAWLWYLPLSQCATTETTLHETLSKLCADGLKLGLVSNTFVPGEVIDRHLHRENLLEFLTVRVYSCEVTYRKPDPAIFKIALERMELEACETMFVGDSLKADICGANRAGLISVLKDPSDKHVSASECPDHRLHRIDELLQIVATHNGDEETFPGGVGSNPSGRL